MLLQLLSGIGLFIFACVFTIVSAVYYMIGQSDIKMQGLAALCWGLFVFVYYSYRRGLRREIEKEFYSTKKKDDFNDIKGDT